MLKNTLRDKCYVQNSILTFTISAQHSKYTEHNMQMFCITNYICSQCNAINKEAVIFF